MAEVEAYVGINNSCGHARAVIVFDAGAPKRERQKIYREVNKWLERGLEVRCIPIEEARVMVGGCESCRPPK